MCDSVGSSYNNNTRMHGQKLPLLTQSTSPPFLSTLYAEYERNDNINKDSFKLLDEDQPQSDQTQSDEFSNDFQDFPPQNESFPIPISWIGKKPDNNRTQSTSSVASSAFSDIQLHAPYTLGHDVAETDNDDDEAIYIPLRPLTLDANDMDIPIQSISDPDVSYESESEESDESEGDEQPSPTADIGSVESATTCSPPSLSPISNPERIQYHKQSTQKYLDIQLTVTDHDDDDDDDGQRTPHHDIDGPSLSESTCDSTCDYNDSLPNSTPRLIESPSSLDSLPDLPDLDDLENEEEEQQEQEQEKEGITGITQISKINVNNAESEDEIIIGVKQEEIECIDSNEAELINDQKIDASYDDICNVNLLQYDWQKPIKNEGHYGAYYGSFQKEVMNNPFFKLTAGDFNDVLKKCQFIRSRWLGEKIRSTRCGKLGKASWKIGEKISELDLFAIKLYTDFEICQRELKKCYRPPTNANYVDIYQYEQRLSHFSHWRRLLNVAILKYGTLLKNKVFYHGINKIMKLEIHPTQRCHGPFSCTSDLEIARGFATKNGLILKMTSKYPRLGTDYFFDASPISAYPDEKEYLIGFMYTRILNVQLGCTKLSIDDLNHEFVTKIACFIISSLIKNNLYSYGPYLELLFQALLITDNGYYEKIEQILCKIIDSKKRKKEQEKLEEIGCMIPEVIKKQFIKCREERKVLKLDKLSNGMEPLFRNERDGMLSMQKIYQFTPNIEELHLFEDYSINNDFISSFLYFIKRYAPNIPLNTVKVFKYSFEGNSEQFQYKQSISKRNETELNRCGWYIHEYHEPNCYKFILTKKKRKQ